MQHHLASLNSSYYCRCVGVAVAAIGARATPGKHATPTMRTTSMCCDAKDAAAKQRSTRHSDTVTNVVTLDVKADLVFASG